MSGHQERMVRNVDRRRLRGRGQGRMASGGSVVLSAATLVPSVVLRRVSWVLEVLVRRCCARLPNVLGSFLKFFDDCSLVGRMLSLHDVAGQFTREVNESVFALTFLNAGCIGLSESCEKVRYSMLSTDL